MAKNPNFIECTYVGASSIVIGASLFAVGAFSFFVGALHFAIGAFAEENMNLFL